MIYVAKRYHHNGIKRGRNVNREKSQWTITPTAEARCFDKSLKSGWNNGNTAWGLHMPNGDPTVLGLTVQNISVFIAKFRHSDPYWSGYPVNYRTNVYDRPPIAVLLAWLRDGIIDKHEIQRIRGGHSCSLSA